MSTSPFLSIPWATLEIAYMRHIVIGIFLAFTAPLLLAQTTPHVPLGIVSDWTHRHVLFPDSNDYREVLEVRKDPRWLHNWYLRHPEAWWPEHHRLPGAGSDRDWSVALGSPAFEPLFDFSFTIGPDSGYGNLTATDAGSGEFLATAGNLTITSGTEVGSYTLYPGGPGTVESPSGFFDYNDLLYPSVSPLLDLEGLLFTGNGTEINIWGNVATNNYTFDNNKTGTQDTGEPFTLIAAPGGGQTFPAKYVFDVTATPSCTNDFVVIGIPATPASGGQANILGLNNLYSGGASPLCSTGPTVMFAYASGTGQVPASVVLSQTGKQIAYVENLPTGSSYFHVLTIGTTGSNGTSATAAAVPGTGNNAVDQRVLLSPNGGTTNQSSTSTAFVLYTNNDANDYAYVTTYSTTGAGSGYLYKIGNVFNGSATPTIVWSAPISAIPSSPVYDSVSNKIFFTDSNGCIDYLTDTGSSPSVVYGTVVASGSTSENPVIVDSTHQMVYASFNSNGSNAVVVQAPTSLASSVSVPVGTKTNIYGGPYSPDFNNAWYSGSGTPLMYVAGTGTGTLPTLYSVGFNASGVMNSTTTSSMALATGIADSSPVTEFYNAAQANDYLFVGVTNHCVAITGGGTAGCVMNAATTALAAGGGTSGITVDNDSSLSEASSIYYATKTGATLVKATQSGLN